MSWRRDPRSAVRTHVCLSGHARYRRRRSDRIRKRYDERKASPEKDCQKRSARIQFLRQPDWTCHRICERNLSSGLCGKTDGNRSRDGSRSKTCGTASDFGSGRHHYPAWRPYGEGRLRRRYRFFQSTQHGVD